MERALEASEPRMTAMFAIFSRLTSGEEADGAEPLSPRRRGRRPSVLLLPVAGLMALIAGLVIGLTASGASACTAAAHPATTVTRFYATCSAPSRR
jgi:hypothetical protein